MQNGSQLREKAGSSVTNPTDLTGEEVAQISGPLTPLLADVFALYLKTKSFHWHISGPHFRDYHLLLDEQAAQIFAMSDDIAERTRKNWWNHNSFDRPHRSHQRVRDNNDPNLGPTDMLAELCSDNNN
jgi:starvation-inducible DNA-binding protein